MGTVLQHFTEPKIARFVCDSNISHIWGREEITGKIKMFQIFLNWQNAALDFWLQYRLQCAWSRQGTLCGHTRYSPLSSAGGLGSHHLQSISPFETKSEIMAHFILQVLWAYWHEHTRYQLHYRPFWYVIKYSIFNIYLRHQLIL